MTASIINSSGSVVFETTSFDQLVEFTKMVDGLGYKWANTYSEFKPAEMKKPIWKVEFRKGAKNGN